MEGAPKSEKPNKKETTSEKALEKAPESLVERARNEALETMMDELVERLPEGLKSTFESHGRTYELTSAEDCMVAFVQQKREAAEALYEEVKSRNNYREEQAIAKLLELFIAYERLVVQYAELKSYYKDVASRISEELPALPVIEWHATEIFNNLDR